ncbi:phage tail terminator-like protein [Neotabrizicola sp. VNH66]|uniref:phage tail terminator-like protein n=1 Tax=Neotabrizicola sp. VNH66 TaxID=3400918 RepID=UPI003C0287B9
MPSTETLIWMALKRRVEALDLSPPLPVAWPGMVFRPPTDPDTRLVSPFLTVTNVSAAPRRLALRRAAHDRVGVLTIVHAAVAGWPYEKYLETAGQIAAWFPEDLCLPYRGVTVRVSSRPHIVDGYLDGGYWRTPVNIPWRSFA